MQIKVCPACYNAFYISVYDNCITCPNCRYIFYERRMQRRVRRQLSVTLSRNGSYMTGITTDYSEEGTGAVFRGGPVDTEAIVALSMGDGAERRARAVWVKQVSRSIISIGLRLF